MTANELADELELMVSVNFAVINNSAQELRTLSSANKWQADQIAKLKTLNSWQASEINFFSADLKKSIVELHADSEIALLQKKALESQLNDHIEQLQQANARIESLEEELKSKSSFIEILNRENLELMTKYCQTKQRLATYEASTIENLLNNKQFQAEVK